MTVLSAAVIIHADGRPHHTRIQLRHDGSYGATGFCEYNGKALFATLLRLPTEVSSGRHFWQFWWPKTVTAPAEYGTSTYTELVCLNCRHKVGRFDAEDYRSHPDEARVHEDQIAKVHSRTKKCPRSAMVLIAACLKGDLLIAPENTGPSSEIAVEKFAEHVDRSAPVYVTDARLWPWVNA